MRKIHQFSGTKIPENLCKPSEDERKIFCQNCYGFVDYVVKMFKFSHARFSSWEVCMKNVN